MTADSFNDLLGFDPMFLLTIPIIAIALLAGFTVRRNVCFDAPTDFISIIVFLIVGGLAIVTSVTASAPAIFFVFFFAFYIVGYWVGRLVVRDEQVDFLKIAEDDEGLIRMKKIEGHYFTHAKHGLCRLPEKNSELFNQLARGIYHKVETNAPLEVTAIMDMEKRPWKGKPQAHVIDDKTEHRLIIIEDIRHEEKRDPARFLKPTISKTVITVAYGSMIPRARLLTEIKTVDKLNENISIAVAKALEVKTEIIPKLPMISAHQLIAIADKSPVMEIIREYLDEEGKKKDGST